MRKKICFVGLDNYPVLNPGRGQHYFGGESVQQTLLAKAFHQAGYEVSMLSYDYGQPDGENVEGIKVWRTMKEGAGLPVVRFIHPRITSIHAALKKADADIYYQSCAGFLTGMVSWFCRRHGRKFIFRTAHDTDCIPGEYIISKHYWRDSRIYEYGLRNADLIAAQSERQRQLLEQNFGLDSAVINMAVELPEKVPTEKDIDVLWVNNFRAFKRPELLAEMARRLSQYRFVMIGGPVPGDEELYERVRREIAATENIEHLGHVPYHEVNSFFSRSRLFLNTSESEGFPNSFLQAWIRGVPVISFFDPDGLIERHGLGTSPDDLDQMAASIEGFLGDEDRLRRASEAVKEYAWRNHAPENVVKAYTQAADWLE